MTSKPSFRKSSYSEGAANCVEGAAVGNVALVRDTKVRESGHLTIDAGSWSRLVASLKG